MELREVEAKIKKEEKAIALLTRDGVKSGYQYAVIALAVFAGIALTSEKGNFWAIWGIVTAIVVLFLFHYNLPLSTKIMAARWKHNIKMLEKKSFLASFGSFLKRHKEIINGASFTGFYDDLVLMMLKSQKKEINLSEDIVCYRKALTELLNLIDEVKAAAKKDKVKQTMIELEKAF